MQDSRDPFQWGLRVSAAGKGRAAVYARSHQFEVGAPIPFDSSSERLSALELVLGAIGADLVNGFRALAERRRIEVDGVEAVVEGRLNNPLVHLGVVGESGHPGMEAVAVKVYVSSLAPPESVREVWEEAVKRSPLACTFARLLKLELNMQATL